jgi:hypothetical protein
MVPFLSFGISLPFIMDYEYNPTANWIWRISNRLQVFLEESSGPFQGGKGENSRTNRCSRLEEVSRKGA